jgi:hypothetical protein
MSSRRFFALVLSCQLGLPIGASLAQQAPRPGQPSPPRRGFYTRVQTQPGATTATSNASRSRSGFAPTRSLDSRGGLGSDPFRGEPDPLRAYGSDDRFVATSSRPNGRTPIARPPEPEPQPPPPVASHNYYPGLRPGQSANRNMVSHCVPGRQAFLHR